LDFAVSEKKRKEKNAFIKTWGYDLGTATADELERYAIDQIMGDH
jgi:hypothetical protein